MTLESCEPFRELISDLADGELEGPEAARVQEHTRTCAACALELRFLSGAIANLMRIPHEDVPRELVSRVMAQVRQPTLLERLRSLALAPFDPAFLRVALPGLALVLCAVAVRPFLPASTPAVPLSDQFASVPRWWGGPLFVNEMPYAVNQSGKLALRPGDSLRTADKVEVSLQLNEAHVEMHPRSSLIMKRDGLYLAEGEIVVRVEDTGAPQPEDKAVKVATPNAVVVHVGTVFRVHVAGGITETEVGQGLVRVYATTGASQDISAGQRATVDSTGIVQGPAVEPPRDLRPARTSPEEIRSISQALPGGPAK